MFPRGGNQRLSGFWGGKHTCVAFRNIHPPVPQCHPNKILPKVYYITFYFILKLIIPCSVCISRLAMDIRLYGTLSSLSSSSKSDQLEPPKSTSSSSDSDSESDSECLYPKPSLRIKPRTTSHNRSKSSSLTSKRQYNKKWEENFPWLEYSEHHQGAFCKVCKKRGILLQRTGGAWITKPFNNWKNAIEKMRAHARSDTHIQSCEAEIVAARRGGIVQQLHHVSEEEKVKDRVAVNALLRCTHFLTKHDIPHTTNFDQLVDLVVSCGGEHL